MSPAPIVDLIIDVPVTIANGETLSCSETVAARFWAKVQRTAHCWLWRGTINHNTGKRRQHPSGSAA